jgi:hypothetical protein
MVQIYSDHAMLPNSPEEQCRPSGGSPIPSFLGIEISNVRISNAFSEIHLSNALRRIIVKIQRNLGSENGYREQRFSEHFNPCRSDIHTFPNRFDSFRIPIWIGEQCPASGNDQMKSEIKRPFKYHGTVHTRKSSSFHSPPA